MYVRMYGYGKEGKEDRALWILIIAFIDVVVWIMRPGVIKVSLNDRRE